MALVQCRIWDRCDFKRLNIQTTSGDNSYIVLRFVLDYALNKRHFRAARLPREKESKLVFLFVENVESEGLRDVWWGWGGGGGAFVRVRGCKGEGGIE